MRAHAALLVATLPVALAAPAAAAGTVADEAVTDEDALHLKVEADVRAFQTGLMRATEAYAGGDRLAAAEVGDLFYRFEESTFRNQIAARDGALYARLEKEWLALRRKMKAKAPAETVRAQLERVLALIEEAHREATGSGGFLAGFLGGFLIIFREGFEALLVVAALAAWLRRSGAGDRIRWLFGGAAAAVAASLVLFAAARSLVRLSGADSEILEGATMLLAAAVLFYVSYWLLSKAQHAKWDAFVRRTAGAALARGSALGFFGVAFLVVFREGFETVLFFEALLQSSGQAAPVAAGFAAGLLVLLVVYGLIRLAGMRLPFGLFFGATGALLYVLAFKFAGDGVRELQEGGLLGETPLRWIPTWGWLESGLGVHPYLETVIPQAALLLLAAVAGTVLLLRRRASVRMPAPASEGGAAQA